MTEKNTAKWDFQKEGKPFDELPTLVKRNPRFLYEYIRTGELPNLDLIEDAIKYDIRAAKKIIEFAKRHSSYKMFEAIAYKQEYKIREFYEEYFIKSGYFNSLLTFEEIYVDICDLDPAIGPVSLKKIQYELKRAQKINDLYFHPNHVYAYAKGLWGEIITRIAENRIKELEE